METTNSRPDPNVSRLALLTSMAVAAIGVTFLFVQAGQRKESPAESAQETSSRSPEQTPVKMRKRRPADREPLFHAASTGDRLRVERMIRAGIDVNQEDRYGRTALFYAVTNGRDGTSIVLSLLDAGADINARDPFDGSPLLFRAIDPGGTESEVKVLIDRGANINLADNKGWTPLMVASDWGHAPLVQLLLDRGADPNAHLLDGRTALMIAAQGAKSEAVSMLLKARADVEARNNVGKTALILAQECYERDRNRMNPYEEGHLRKIIELLK